MRGELHVVQMRPAASILRTFVQACATMFMMAQLLPRFTEHAFDHHPSLQHLGSTHLHSSSRTRSQAAPGSCQHAIAWPHAACLQVAGQGISSMWSQPEALAFMLPACTGMLRSVWLQQGHWWLRLTAP